MKFFATAAVLSSVLSLATAYTVSPRAANLTRAQDLAAWWEVVPLSIFPNHTGWEASFDEHISRNVTASFNYISYDFEGLKTFFKGVYSIVSTRYDYLKITVVDNVVLPNQNDAGGYGYSTGREEGVASGTTTVREERDALFAVISEINGKRQVTEWREVTNFF